MSSSVPTLDSTQGWLLLSFWIPLSVYALFLETTQYKNLTAMFCHN